MNTETGTGVVESAPVRALRVAAFQRRVASGPASGSCRDRQEPDRDCRSGDRPVCSRRADPRQQHRGHANRVRLAQPCTIRERSHGEPSGPSLLVLHFANGKHAVGTGRRVCCEASPPPSMAQDKVLLADKQQSPAVRQAAAGRFAMAQINDAALTPSPLCSRRSKASPTMIRGWQSSMPRSASCSITSGPARRNSSTCSSIPIPIFAGWRATTSAGPAGEICTARPRRKRFPC